MGFLPAAVSGLAVGSALSGGFVRGAGREHLRLLRARPAQPTLLQSSAPGPPSAGRGRRHLARAPRLAASSPQLVQFFGFCLGICIQYFWCATPCAGPCKPRSGRHPRGPSSWSVVQKEVLVLCLLHPGNGLTFLLPVSPLHVLWCRGLIAFFISWKVEDWIYILNL